MTEPSESLLDLALFALDHAAESVIASGGPLVPFAMTEVAGKRSLARFVGDLQRGQEQAREAVRSADGIDRGAVAWDGYITVDGQRTDAVLVEASEVGDPESLLLAQRYQVTGRLRKRVERVGNAAIAGRGTSLF